jgi:hypothetical protein
MSGFNKKALNVLEKVSEHFNTDLTRYTPIESNYSVGIETEIKFKYYYPELYERYFKGGRWKEYIPEQKNAINEIVTYTETEKGILSKLEKTKELGIKKGNDCYWEFALDPVTDLSLILTQLQLLIDLNLLPNGQHSLHITIGNMNKTVDSYWLLFICEMLFSSQKRLSSGINKEKRATYFRKGESGLLVKRWRLVECKTAIEFRSVGLFIENSKISITHEKLSYLNRLLNDSEFQTNEINKCKNILNDIGLPNENWKNYKDNPEIWDKYYDSYETIKEKLELNI